MDSLREVKVNPCRGNIEKLDIYRLGFKKFNAIK